MVRYDDVIKQISTIYKEHTKSCLCTKTEVYFGFVTHKETSDLRKIGNIYSAMKSF